MNRFSFAAGALALGVVVMAGPAAAKDARCFTTDDGKYPCQFKALDKTGSFEISASGKPTFSLWVDAPGVAFGSAIFEEGGRSVPLPGEYRRSKTDGACWQNTETQTQICAW